MQKDVLFKVGELATLSTDQVIETLAVSVDYTQLWDEQQLLLTGRFGIDQGHMITADLRLHGVVRLTVRCLSGL